MNKFTLKELGVFKNGANYPKGSYGKGDKIVNVKDLFKGRYVPVDELDELKPNALKDKTIYLVEDGDILFTRSSLVRSGAGMCAMINQPTEDILFCGFIIRYRVDKTKVYPLYMLYLLRSPMYRKLFTGSQQTNITNINQDTLGDIEVCLPVDDNGNPDVAEQKRIVSLLDNIDSKIENNNAINTELEAMAKTIYDYWFLQFKFPDENGKPYKSSGGKMVWNEELNREIPDGWNSITLGKIFSITMGSSPKGETLNESKKGTEFYQGSTDFGKLYPMERVYTTAPIRMAKAQDVLMSVRAPVGAMNIAMNDCCIGRGLASINHKSTLFAWNTLKTFQKYFDIFNGNGTTFGALTSDDFKEQLTLKPAIDIVDKYCEIVKPLERRIRTLTQENQELTSLRDFLLPLLMNGQVIFKESE